MVLSSSLITFKSSFLEFIIFLYPLIRSANFLISTSISLIPRAVSFWSLSSKIAITWGSVSEYKFFPFLSSISEISFKDLFIFHLVLNNDFLASSGVFEDRIIFIILSKFSTDTDNPIRMWALSSAFFKSNLVFLITTSSRNVKKFDKNSFKLQILGLPSTIAKVLKPKELSIDVFL